MSEKPDEVDINDEDLELAAGGGVILIKNQSQQQNNTYTYDQTIYIPSITDTVT